MYAYTYIYIYMLTPPPKIYPFHALFQSSPPPPPFFLILLLLFSSLVFVRFLWVVLRLCSGFTITFLEEEYEDEDLPPGGR